MAVTFSSLREYVRVLLGDQDPDVPIYDSTQIDTAFKAVLNFGEIEGYEVNGAGDSVVPVSGTEDISGSSLKLLIYKTAKLFTPNLSQSYAVRTRAFSESFGGNRELMMQVLSEIYMTEHGDQNG